LSLLLLGEASAVRLLPLEVVDKVITFLVFTLFKKKMLSIRMKL